jgi:hypothetical protein
MTTAINAINALSLLGATEPVLYAIWNVDDIRSEFDGYEDSSDPEDEALGKFANDNATALWAEFTENDRNWEYEFDRFYEGMRNAIYDFVKAKHEASKEAN